MRLTNQVLTPAKPIENVGFDGQVEESTYIGTSDTQMLRVWGNCMEVQPSDGMYSALLKDRSDGVTGTGNVTVSDDSATMPGSSGWWWDGILLAKGAHVTIPCRGWFGDEDWRVMQALGVVCFARDTAPY